MNKTAIDKRLLRLLPGNGTFTNPLNYTLGKTTPNETNLKRNTEIADKLYDTLGGTDIHRPAYEFREDAHPLEGISNTDAKYTDPKTGKKYNDFVGASNEVSDFNDAFIAHEQAHITSPIQRGRFRNLFAKINGVHNSKYYQLIAPLLQAYGGVPGNVLTNIPMAVRLAEETQANVRAYKALKKMNGKVTPKNLAALGISEASYLGNIILANTVNKKMTRFFGNKLLGLLKK